MPDTGTAAGLGPRCAAILFRRSYRSFRPDPLPAPVTLALRDVVERAPCVLGARSGYVRFLDGPFAERMPGAVMSGVVGKINPWLLRSRPPAFLVVAGDSSGGRRDGERHWYNVDGTVAAQLAVLEAAGRGIGSCWMAGFHEASVARAADLPPGHRPLAVIPLGFPAVGPGAKFTLLGTGWDAAVQKLMSSRRKPLERIAFRERFGVPWTDEPAAPPVRRGIDAADEGGWPGVGSLRPAARFAERTIARDEITLLLECARWAPSAENSQIARHIVVAGREAVAALHAAAFPDAPQPRPGELPPLIIVAVAAPYILRARTREQPFFLIDVPIAVTNLLVAAADFGFGWQVAFRVDYAAVAAQLGIPEDHKVVALVGLGAPAPAPPAAAAPILSQLR
jgi:nitroreductase